MLALAKGEVDFPLAEGLTFVPSLFHCAIPNPFRNPSESCAYCFQYLHFSASPCLLLLLAMLFTANKILHFRRFLKKRLQKIG